MKKVIIGTVICIILLYWLLVVAPASTGFVMGATAGILVMIILPLAIIILPSVWIIRRFVRH